MAKLALLLLLGLAIAFGTSTGNPTYRARASSEKRRGQWRRRPQKNAYPSQQYQDQVNRPRKQLCNENYHVEYGRCTQCPQGLTNQAGDDPKRGDSACVSGVVHNLDWVQILQYKQTCFQRLDITINGQSPGPTIIANQGDAINVTLKNNMQDASLTSIHWHGIKMLETAWSDGTPTVSCPVPAFGVRNYYFIVDKPGTYWYHSHISVQRAFIFGAIIVNPVTGPGTDVALPYDAEFDPDVTKFIDLFPFWPYVGDQGTILSANGAVIVGAPDNLLTPSQLLAGDWPGPGINGYIKPPGGPSGPTAQSRTLLFSGVGLWTARDLPEDQCIPFEGIPPAILTCGINTVDGFEACDYKVYNVTAGQTYRWRLVGALSAITVLLEIEGHTMTVVEADGRSTEPYVIASGDSLIIAPGQVYSVIVTADQPVGNYWINILAVNGNIPEIGYAVMRYAGAPQDAPVTAKLNAACNNTAPLVKNEFCPLQFQNATANIEQYNGLKSLAPVPQWVSGEDLQYKKEEFRQFIANVKTGAVSLFSVNNIVNDFYAMMGNPLLLNARFGTLDSFESLLSSPETPPGLNFHSSRNLTFIAEQMQIGVHVEYVKLNTVVDVIFEASPTATPWDHPMHLHGQNFFLLGSGKGEFDHEVAEQQLNLVNPASRHTAMIPVGGWLWIRWFAGNPGTWFHHCHIDNHIIGGFGLSWMVSPDLVRLPDVDLPVCGGPLVAIQRTVENQIRATTGVSPKHYY